MIRAAALMIATLMTTAQPLAAQEAGDLDARLDLLARPDSAERLAAFSRNLYDALIARGFGHNEAVQLVAAFARSGTVEPDCRSSR